MITNKEHKKLARNQQVYMEATPVYCVFLSLFAECHSHLEKSHSLFESNGVLLAIWLLSLFLLLIILFMHTKRISECI